MFRTRLPPTVAALAMALSSLSVVASSLALHLYRPPKINASATPLPRSGKNNGIDTTVDPELHIPLLHQNDTKRDNLKERNELSNLEEGKLR